MIQILEESYMDSRNKTVSIANYQKKKSAFLGPKKSYSMTDGFATGVHFYGQHDRRIQHPWISWRRIKDNVDSFQ